MQYQMPDYLKRHCHFSNLPDELVSERNLFKFRVSITDPLKFSALHVDRHFLAIISDVMLLIVDMG
jgi:hypothetical protein